MQRVEDAMAKGDNHVGDHLRGSPNQNFLLFHKKAAACDLHDSVAVDTVLSSFQHQSSDTNIR